MWYNETTEYYWRGRYDRDNDRLIFEYINDLSGDNWAENTNARIDCSGFDAGAIDGDFTVRRKDSIAKTTIHYSDGIDTFIAESNEASATGWSWINSTTVFDATAPDWYQRVNLCADRQTPNGKLYATAVFNDDSEGTQYVVCKVQSSSGDITGWGVSKDISDNTNTSTIYGESCRSIGEGGAEKDDVLFVYKEGDAIKSQYMSAGVTKGIQVVDATTYPGRAMFDLEHGIELDIKMGHVIYVDSDGTIKWRERESGNTTAWNATQTMTSETTGHESVAIVEHGNGLLYTIWREGSLLKYRLHRCFPDVWSPILENPANSYDVSVDAVVDTTSVAQLQTADSIPITDDIMACWIGQIDANLCEIGWGIIIDGRSTIYSRDKELTLPTDDSDMDIPFIDTEYVDVSVDDDVYVQQCARDTLDPYGVFVWKDQYTDNQSIITSTCILKASIAPSVSTVYLQIYNRNSSSWETLDSDNTTAADTELTLNGVQNSDLSYYYDSDYFVIHRIYQKTE